MTEKFRFFEKEFHCLVMYQQNHFKCGKNVFQKKIY